jgi:hypothetical protein
MQLEAGQTAAGFASPFVLRDTLADADLRYGGRSDNASYRSARKKRGRRHAMPQTRVPEIAAQKGVRLPMPENADIASGTHRYN